jgi:serine/threonine protein kinase
MKPLPGPERWRLIAPLLEQALEMPPEKRGAFLDQACGGDSGLRAEIEALLAADSDAGAFLGAPVDVSILAPAPGEGAEAAPDAARLAGTFIGAYRVVREIGRGGMGVIYEAEQQRPRRSVALKVILGGRHVDAETIRMFQRESDSLARLKHPSIASIYESGCTDEGQHFFAMELVEGRTLDGYLVEDGAPATPSDVRRRLALFRKIAAAVAYAHQRGVIHRDLKPSNILVLRPGAARTKVGGDEGSGSVPYGLRPAEEAPDVKILDFGLARITEPDAEAPPTLTIRGSIHGTLPYMSPEQVRGRSDEIDVRTDVYSLGVLLYRMLSGRLPYDLEGVEITDAARLICEQPPRPLGTSAGGGARLDRDLAIIVHKALEKEPVRRYQTAAAFDEDVGRYLNGQPILARPPSTAYQIRKLVARHKLGVVAALFVGCALAGAAVTSTIGLLRARRAEAAAREEASKATTIYQFLLGVLHAPDPAAQGRDVKVADALGRAESDAAKTFAGQPVVEAGVRDMLAETYRGLGLFEKAVDQRKIAVGLFTKTRGPDDPETLHAMTALTDDLTLREEIPEAVSTGRQAVDRARRNLGEEASVTLSAKAVLSGALQRSGNFKDAEILARSVVDVMRRRSETSHPTFLHALSTLEMSVEAQGRLQEAEPLARELLALSGRTPGESSPETLNVRNNLASLLGEEGKLDEAEPILVQVLEQRQRVLGPDHPDTLSSLANLAAIKFLNHRPADAESLYRDALARSERTLPPGHPHTENYRSSIGQCLTAEGRCREAIGYLEVAQERLQKNQGIHDMYAQDAIQGLAEAYEACGRKADAERFRKLIDAPAGQGK